MPYSDDEIQSSVEQLVRPSIRRPYDTLGVRRTDVSFSDIQEAAAGVFLLYPRAPFYCLWLGTQQLLEDLEAEAALLDRIEQCITALGRRVLPVEDVTPLFNARAALRELSQAAASQAGALKDITKAPAFQRFKDNTDRFLADAGSAVKDSGDIVQTPNEARILLPSLITQLEESHTALVQKVRDLQAGLENYNSLGLSSIVSQSIIDNALKVVGGHADGLQAKTPTQRLEVLRQVVLDLLSSKSVVSQFGSFAGATDIYSLTGTGAPYSDADHPAIPATLLCPAPAAFKVVPGKNILDVHLDAPLAPRSVTDVDSVAAVTDGAEFVIAAGWPLEVQVGDIIYHYSLSGVTRWAIVSFDGPRQVATTTGVGTAPVGASTPVEVLPAPSASISLPYSYAAQILGTQPEIYYASTIAGPKSGWIIGDGSAPTRPTGYGKPNNDRVKFNINGVDYECTLTLSSPGDATNEAVPRTAEQICFDINATLAPSGYVAEPYLSPRRFYGRVNKVAVAGATADFNLPGGFGNFGSLSIVVGDYINVLDGTETGYWVITQVNATYLRATKVGGGTAVNETVTIEVGPALRHIRIVPADYAMSVAFLDVLQVVDDQGPNTAGANTFGIPAGIVVRSQKSSAKDVAAAANKGSSLILASAPFIATDTVKGRTSLTNNMVLTAYRFSGSGNSSFVAGSPNTLTVAVEGAETAGVVVGDALVLRSGTYASSSWEVTAVSDTAITAISIGVGGSETDVRFDVGPDLVLAAYDMIRIPSGPNRGDYYISMATQPTPLDWPITATLPLPADPVTGLPLELELELGHEYLAVASRNQTTASRVVLRGNFVSELFDDYNLAPFPTGQIGSSTYFQLPQVVRGLEPNDVLELYADDYNVPTIEALILGVDGQIVTLGAAIDNLPTWTFDAVPPPFARVRAGSTVDFTAFQTSMVEWLDRAEQQQAYFTELYRLINPLTANVNPTSSSIGDAKNHLHSLSKVLTENAKELYGGTADTLEAGLTGYVVRPLGPVDALIRSYKEKGADRAVDLLCAGLFVEFFNATDKTASYAGDLQEKMRQVVMRDLPVKKVNRPDAYHQRLIGSTETPDKEYNLEDTEGQGIRPDPV